MKINTVSAFGVQKNINKNAFGSNSIDFNYSSLNKSDILGVSKRVALDNFSTSTLDMLASNNKLYLELAKNESAASGLDEALGALKEGQREANKFSAVFNSSLMNENKMLLLDAALLARAQGSVESKPIKIKGGKYYTSSYFEEGNLAILKIKSQKDGAEADFVDFLSKDKSMQNFKLKSVKKGNLKAFVGDVPQEIERAEVSKGAKVSIFKKENNNGSFSISSQIKNAPLDQAQVGNSKSEVENTQEKKPKSEPKSAPENDQKNDYFGISLQTLKTNVPTEDIIERQNVLKIVLANLKNPKKALDTSTLPNKFAKEEVERAQEEIVPYVASVFEYGQMFLNQAMVGIGYDTDKNICARGMLELAKIAQAKGKEKSEPVQIGNREFCSFLEKDGNDEYLTIRAIDGSLEARYKKTNNVFTESDSYTLAEVAIPDLRIFCDLVSKEPKEIMSKYHKNEDGSYSAEFFASKEYEKVRSPKIYVMEDCKVKYNTNFLGMTEKKFCKKDTIFAINQATGLVEQYQSKKATQFGFSSHFEFDQYEGKWKYKIHKRINSSSN